MHVFPTNRTIVLIFVSQTIVIVECAFVNAHGTLIAVTIILRSTHTAESTFIAVKWLILQLHPQIANITVIFCKCDCTIWIDALIRTWLTSVAFLANNFFCIMMQYFSTFLTYSPHR